MTREVRERAGPPVDSSVTVPPPRTRPAGDQPQPPSPTGPTPPGRTTTQGDDPVVKAASRYRRNRRLIGTGIGIALLAPGWALVTLVGMRHLTGTHLGAPWYAAAIALTAVGTLGYAVVFGSRTGALIRERPPYDRVDDLAHHYLRVRSAASTDDATPPAPELLAAAGRAARRLSVTCPHSASRLKAAMLAQRYFDDAAGTRTPGRRHGAVDLAETLETTHRLLTSLRPV